MLIPGISMTIDAIRVNGYDLGERRLERGYVSRKKTIYEIKEAQGRRKGQLYIETPCWASTQYHYRQYLVERSKDVL